MVRVESVGSIWLFDEDLKRYMRMPKTEGPREPKPYYDQHESLDDLVWHEYLRWLVVEDPCAPRLVIHLPDVQGAVVSPLRDGKPDARLYGGPTPWCGAT